MSANAEIIAELRRVLNERDQAREQLDLTKRELGRWVDRETKAVRERDEARADAERYLADLRRCASEPYEHAKERAEAYRRGAEAMRKRCAMWVKHNSHEDGLGMGSQRMESALAALPIPEEP